MTTDLGFYEVDVWGDPVGDGASGSRYCTLGGVAKTNTPAPYAVANEYICGRLGLLMGLPVPPGVIVGADDGRPAFVCLRFGRRGEKPPPVIAQHLVEDEEFMAAGIVAFDCWIGNEDRHDRNLAYSRDPPLDLAVFDHSHALMGSDPGGAVHRFSDNLDKTYVGSGCLAPLMSKGGAFPEWAKRIQSVDPGVIKSTCRAVKRVGAATEPEVRAAEEFILHRRTRILRYLQHDVNALPRVMEWGLA